MAPTLLDDWHITDQDCNDVPSAIIGPKTVPKLISTTAGVKPPRCQLLVLHQLLAISPSQTFLPFPTCHSVFEPLLQVSRGRLKKNRWSKQNSSATLGLMRRLPELSIHLWEKHTLYSRTSVGRTEAGSGKRPFKSTSPVHQEENWHGMTSSCHLGPSLKLTPDCPEVAAIALNNQHTQN